MASRKTHTITHKRLNDTRLASALKFFCRSAAIPLTQVILEKTYMPGVSSSIAVVFSFLQTRACFEAFQLPRYERSTPRDRETNMTRQLGIDMSNRIYKAQIT
ncbi:hypothetical protein HYE67_007690 [Fusarium culmorum]|uniref:Uncharacterized protein n=1 Tax=Fusarium culmorum TaxID=5516 RepID=A0A2T4H089_FUSCU|nr:hypothetical protein FCULG_00008792 [Fusarium culmorum]QPC65459.1 hypothetical protein HYE67_007690 [Fusarium culmorum]